MTNAAHHIRVAVDGLAREIGRRVAEQQQEKTERAGKMHDVPPGYEFWRAEVEMHARAVLLDYLLGDFNPSKHCPPQPPGQGGTSGGDQC